MTATAAIRRPEPGLHVPTTVRPGVTWPRTADILDVDGGYLTTVELPLPRVDGVLPFGEVDDPSVLLTYVFGRGQRTVMLGLEDEQVTGWLGTRWDGNHRSWWLDVDEGEPD
jgi:hypothetical protein